MRISILNLHCLNAIADDYETVASILEDVRRSSHGNVDATEISACLAELMRDGMADACRFDAATSQYQRIPSMPEDITGLWFRITDLGRRQLDNDWVDD